MSRFQRMALAFAYIYLVMTGYYILKPVRESFFLGEKGYRNLPKAHLLVMVVTFVTVLIYTRASRRLGVARLVTSTNTFFLICIGVFWVVLTQLPAQRGLMAWVYFCWVSVFVVFAVTLFWSVTHTVFSTEEGAKSYGIIGSGATLGAMTGGWITETFAENVGTENLLLCSAGILAACIPLGMALAGLSSNPLVGQNPDSNSSNNNSPEPKAAGRDTLSIFRNSPYLCVLGLIVTMTIVISVLDDYRYGEIISRELTDRDKRTSFYGSVYFRTNIIGLFFSLVLTGPVQTAFGPRPGMLLYIAAVIGSAIAFWISPGINVVFYSAIILQAVGYSIYQWSRELLYTITTREEKFIAKGFIDTFMFRAGAGTAALLLLAAQNYFPAVLENAVRDMSLVTVPLALVLCVFTLWIGHRFHVKKREMDSCG